LLRLAAALVLLLAALSVMTTATAYKTARPTNGVSVKVSAYDAAQISVSRGSGGDRFEWLQGQGTGAIALDLTRANLGATGYRLDPNSTYTAYRVFRITNNTTALKNIQINHGSGAVTVVSGYIGANPTLLSQTNFDVPAGSYVELNLEVVTGSSGGDFSYTILVN